MSCGEKNGFVNYNNDSGVPTLKEKTEGREKFANGDYAEAINLLEKAWKDEKDPSTLIALNNARAMQNLSNGDKVFTIAISTGFDDDLMPKAISGSILTGVAWRQYEVNNKEQDKYKFKLIVIMADDKNNYDNQAVKIAKELVQREQIIGVIGPYSSKATYYVIDEYFKKLVLVSATSAATVTAYKEYKDKNKAQDLSWFFRPVPTTEIGAEHLVKYLKDQKYKNVIVFYQDRDLFSKSFYEDFIEKSKDSNLNIADKVQYLKKKETELQQKIEYFKKNYDKKQTAFVVLPDAYTETESKERKNTIIEENNGHFFIAGNNTLFDPEVLKLKKNFLKKMVITVPWYPSQEDNNKLKGFLGNNSKLRFWSEDDDVMLTWHIAMSYDATQMLVEAISQQISEGKNPTRNFKTEGLTGEIILQKADSDRKYPFDWLIRLDCSDDSSSFCRWPKNGERYPPK